MKIDELRRLLREADRENLEKAFAESYKSSARARKKRLTRRLWKFWKEGR